MIAFNKTDINTLTKVKLNDTIIADFFLMI